LGRALLATLTGRIAVALTVRAADLVADRDLIIETLRRHLNPRSDGVRFDWLYLSNPYGKAAAWIAQEGGDTVGMASAFPRRVVFQGADRTCWVLGDFCIDPRYRALGPAVQLNRACLSGVDRGAVTFCYDFPSVSMMAVYRRLGIEPFGRVTRFSKVLRWGARLRASSSNAVVRGVLGWIGSLADLRPSRRTRTDGVDVAVHGGDCDGAFDGLNHFQRTRFPIYLERSAAYLGWRYRRNPLARYEILTARRGLELAGYAVLMRNGTDAVIADVSARDDVATFALLDDLAERLRGSGTATVSAPVLSSHPIVPLLLRTGFRAREESPVIFYGCPDAGRGPDAGTKWPLGYGDRDS
jgi:hypothetical protein